MLNISPERINHRIESKALGSLKRVKSEKASKSLTLVSTGILVMIIVVLFLPWTQTIDSRGAITTLKPDQRPQTIHSTIAGRIENWFVQEGSFVEKGDTILFISEIKDDYFDPALLPRTKAQIQAKNSSVSSYASKADALDRQIAALQESRAIKLQQTKNKLIQSRLKIQSDSIGFAAAQTNLEIATKQYDRMVSLYENGLKSLTDLEGRRLKLQETQAKAIESENKLLSSRNEYLNTQADLSAIENEYADKVAKAQSDKFAALSGQYEAEGNVMKLENQYSNYDQRQKFYHILAPQTGYITRVLRFGIGETVKEGEELVSIMPVGSDLSVELYVTPNDLPLVEIGSPVRLIFDGWPALVFSGWPGASSGTYGGKVVAIDKFISANGKYRLLVSPDPDDIAWPDALRFGSGVKGLFLLNDVAVWYEMWRQINGFPPVFYDQIKPDDAGKSDAKGKK